MFYNILIIYKTGQQICYKKYFLIINNMIYYHNPYLFIHIQC